MMKQLLLILTLAFSLGSFGQALKGLDRVDMMTDLKNNPITSGAQVLMVGKTSITDGLGGFYRWDETSTATEDMTNLNVIASNLSSTGRWVRTFQRVQVLPHGILVLNGGFKTFYAASSTASTGKATINLTMDNTTTGTAFCTSIKYNDSVSLLDAANPQDAIQQYIVSTTSDLKQTTHGYYKVNAVTLALASLVGGIIPVANVGAGIPVNFKIECI